MRIHFFCSGGWFNIFKSNNRHQINDWTMWMMSMNIETTAIFTVYAFTFAKFHQTGNMCFAISQWCYVIRNGFSIWIQSIRNLDFLGLSMTFTYIYKKKQGTIVSIWDDLSLRHTNLTKYMYIFNIKVNSDLGFLFCAVIT